MVPELAEGGVAALLLALGLAVVLLGRREQGGTGLPSRYIAAATAWTAAAVLYTGEWLSFGELRWGLVLLGAFGVLAATFANEAVASRLRAGASNRLEAAVAMAASRRAGLFALMVVVAPVFEEVLFRGLLFGVLEPFGVSVALLGTAAVFALSHFDGRSVVGLFVSGLIFAALRAATGGLATPLVAHALANGFGFAMFVLQSRRSGKSEAPYEARARPRSAGQSPESGDEKT